MTVPSLGSETRCGAARGAGVPRVPSQPRAPDSYFKATEPQLAVRTRRENGAGSSPSTPGAPPPPPSFATGPDPPLRSLARKWSPWPGEEPPPSSPPAVQESSRESSGRGQAPPPRRAHFAHPLSGPRPCLQRPCVCRTDCIEL